MDYRRALAPENQRSHRRGRVRWQGRGTRALVGSISVHAFCSDQRYWGLIFEHSVQGLATFHWTQCPRSSCLEGPVVLDRDRPEIYYTYTWYRNKAAAALGEDISCLILTRKGV